MVSPDDAGALVLDFPAFTLAAERAREEDMWSGCGAVSEPSVGGGRGDDGG